MYSHPSSFPPPSRRDPWLFPSSILPLFLLNSPAFFSRRLPQTERDLFLLISNYFYSLPRLTPRSLPVFPPVDVYIPISLLDSYIPIFLPLPSSRFPVFRNFSLALVQLSSAPPSSLYFLNDRRLHTSLSLSLSLSLILFRSFFSLCSLSLPWEITIFRSG